ncbi:MAG: MarR family transcriptional regulator [Bdellovibrionales bacterium]|nr:MarR family transcriptional regulator [Bdellovibrionales bacterium]
MAKHTPSHLTDHVGFWLRRVSNHVSHAFIRKLKERNVSAAEWVVLRTLYENGSASIGYLGQATGLTKGAVSKVTKKLFSKKLLYARASNQDRRSVDVFLTKRGRDLVPTLADVADENDRQYFSCLKKSDQNELMCLLKKVVETHQLVEFPTN